MAHRDIAHRHLAHLTLFALATAGVSCADVTDPVAVETSPLVIKNTSFPAISVATPHCRWGQFRCQPVDIIDLGANSFVIGYIDVDRNLRYQYWTTTGGQQGATILAGTDAYWVRANTSNSGNSFGSDVNYFAVEVSDPDKNPANGGHGVFLDKFTKTGANWSMTRTLVASGSPRLIPAVATKGTPLTGDLFFAWQSGQGFVGRLLRFRYPNESTWTPMFEAGAGNFSSDVIYNSSSNKWIVGTMTDIIGGVVTQNYVFTSDGDSLPSQVTSNNANSGNDGHHTSVAYNPLSSDGSYVWWHHDNDHVKGVYVHDNMGRQLTVPLLPEAPHVPGFQTQVNTLDPPSTVTALTVPVARTSSASVPYAFLKSSGLYGLRADKTWALLDDFGYVGQPYAMRSLSTETVALYQNRLIISDWPGSPALFTTQDWVGSVDAFYTGGLNEAVYRAWMTSPSGSETFDSGLAIDLTKTAKEITASPDNDLRQEVFYVGSDDVVRHLRETAMGSNNYEDLGQVTPSPIKAKKLAATWNWDGTLSLFYIRYPDGVLCYTRQTEPSSSTWTAEAPLAGATTKARRIAFAQLPGGNLQIVFTDLSDVLWQTYQIAASGNMWTSPAMVGSSSSKAREILLMRDDAISYNLRLIYTRSASDNTDGYVMQSAQTAPGSWTTPSTLFSTTAKQISMSYNKDGHLHLVFVAINDVIYQAYRKSSGAWTAVSPLRSSEPKAKRVSAMRHSGNDGRLEVFYIGLDDVVFRTSQTGSSLGERDFYTPQALVSR